MEESSEKTPPTERRKSTVEQQLFDIKKLFAIFLSIFTFVVLPALVWLALTSHDATQAASKADTNSRRLNHLVHELRDKEAMDARNLQNVGWRGCARAMLDRARAYDSQRQIAQLPLLRDLIPAKLLRDSERKLRQSLPILNCDPNLCGAQPTGLAPEVVDQFVDAFAEGKLEGNPKAPPQHEDGRTIYTCPIPAGRAPLQLVLAR